GQASARGARLESGGSSAQLASLDARHVANGREPDVEQERERSSHELEHALDSRHAKTVGGGVPLLQMTRKRDIDQLQNEIKELFADLWQVPRFSGLRRGFR